MRRSGYTKHQRFYRFAEDLGYRSDAAQDGQGLAARPASIAATFSTGDFRDIGVGVGWGTPKPRADSDEFATYTILYAVRRS